MNYFVCKHEKFYAFTIAEVLITLGIIGVVAIMTIPTLMQQANNREYVSSFLKTYQSVSTAVNMLTNESGGDITNGFANAQALMDALVPKLNVVKKCASGSANGDCWPQIADMTILNGDDFDEYNDNGPTVILANGASLRIYNKWYRPACNQWYRTKGGRTEGACAVAQIDVNGPKKPNRLGRDIQELLWYPTFGVLANGEEGSLNYYADGYCSTSYAGVDSGCGCAAKLIMEGAMNY